MQAMPDILILLMMNMCMLIEGGEIMEVNNVKENLKMKQTYKEIKKNKKQEFFSELKEIFNSPIVKCIAINMVLAIIIVLCSYACFNSIIPLDYNSVQHVIRIMIKISIGIMLVLIAALLTPALMFIESKIQYVVIAKKIEKMSYQKMQYIPLTKSEFIKLEIHDIHDYVTFLNEYLKVKIDYFHFFELLDWDQTGIATPPQMIIDRINESLIFLEELPESNQQITFDKENEKFIIGGR